MNNLDTYEASSLYMPTNKLNVTACSIAVLIPFDISQCKLLYSLKLYPVQDSNPYLMIRSHTFYSVELTGLTPVFWFLCIGDRTRTCDHSIPNAAFYQLNYTYILPISSSFPFICSELLNKNFHLG